MTNHKLPSTIDLSKVILWQYNKAQRLQDLVKALEESAEVCSADIWSKIGVLFDINNPVEDGDEEYLKYREIGLVLVSKLFGIDRPSYPETVSITKAQELELFRRCIKGRIYLMDSDGSVPDINEFLRIVFPEVNCYVNDGFDMTIQYSFPSDFATNYPQLEALRATEGFLPRPAGVFIGEIKPITDFRIALQQYEIDSETGAEVEVSNATIASEEIDGEGLNNLDNATFVKE